MTDRRPKSKRTKKSHWHGWTNPVFQCIALISAMSIFSQCSPLAPSQQMGGEPPGGNLGGIGPGGSITSPGVITISAVRNTLASQLSSEQNLPSSLRILSGSFSRDNDASIKMRLFLTTHDLDTLESNSRVEIYALDRMVQDADKKAILQRTHAKASSSLSFSLKIYSPQNQSSAAQSALPFLNLRITYATSDEEAMFVLSSQSAQSTSKLVRTCRRMIQDGFNCDIEIR